jgi:hypothetical protein
MQEQQHRREVEILSRLRECRNAVAAHQPLPALPPRPGQPQRTCAQQFFRGIFSGAYRKRRGLRI